MALAELQSAAKRDPEGHVDDVRAQLRHYESLLQVVQLQADSGADEFAPLADTLSKLYSSFPKLLAEFPSQLLSLIDNQHASLPRAVRRQLFRSLVTLRNKGGLKHTDLLPTMMKLLRSHDKPLRQHVRNQLVVDIATANRKSNAQWLNRPAQSLIHSELQSASEATAKRALGILTELYRRNVWTDARCVNIVVSAALHPKQRVMLAALKFLLGQDEQDAASHEDQSDSESDDGADSGDGGAVTGNAGTKRKRNSEAFNKLSQEEVFRAYHKGTAATKKKKQKKLKREVSNLRRKAQKSEGSIAPKEQGARFAALQLVNDPQGTTEKLFATLRSQNQSFQSKLLLIQVVSRLIGTHKLLLLHFYPFITRFTHPQQRDCTVVMASIVQATHELVPPDTLQPLLRHIVDGFVHDRARPEVIALGLHTVREMCARAPLIINDDLLQDLALYKKYKEKAVTAAARSLIQLFRELAPALLQKKDRGKGHDINARRAAFGEDKAAKRVEGADLLEAALKKNDDEDGETDENENKSENGEEHTDQDDQGSDAVYEEENSEGEREKEEGSENEDDPHQAEEIPESSHRKDANTSKDAVEGEHEEDARTQLAAEETKELESINDLKQQLKETSNTAPYDVENVELEKARILSQQDYKKIRMLKTKQQLDQTISKHGARKAQQIGSSEVEAVVRRNTEDRVEPMSLIGEHRRKPSKEEKKERIREGREGREAYGASAKKKKKKSGGLSNKEKEKKKRLPLAARNMKAAERRLKRSNKKK